MPRNFVVAREVSAGRLDPDVAEPTLRGTKFGEHLVALRAGLLPSCCNRLEPLDSQSSSPTACTQH